MPKKSNAAGRIVHATTLLLASRGYFGIGLSGIIARAEASKGSLHHHFLKGKPQIASVATGFVADEVVSLLDCAGIQAPHARNVLRQFIATPRSWLEHSCFEEAYPVLFISLSIDAELAPMHAECRRAFRARYASIECALCADGLVEKLAASCAWPILAALEGAVVVIHVERLSQALDTIEEELQALLPAQAGVVPRSARYPSVLRAVHRDRFTGNFAVGRAAFDQDVVDQTGQAGAEEPGERRQFYLLYTSPSP